MQKHEFEERIESTVSDEDYKLIEFVYQFHPVIRNVSGKDEVAELYKSFGMALFRDMEPRAKKAKEVEEKIRKIMMVIPNIIDPSVPIGKDDSENRDTHRVACHTQSRDERP